MTTSAYSGGSAGFATGGGAFAASVCGGGGGGAGAGAGACGTAGGGGSAQAASERRATRGRARSWRTDTSEGRVSDRCGAVRRLVGMGRGRRYAGDGLGIN